MESAEQRDGREQHGSGDGTVENQVVDEQAMEDWHPLEAFQLGEVQAEEAEQGGQRPGGGETQGPEKSAG